ncbi:hypothetical protein C8J56DRAFT_890553 [Mycena floridula]|nr:hypothetical protein C8J56DRAFT_890553 [Mycena floridula]
MNMQNYSIIIILKKFESIEVSSHIAIANLLEAVDHREDDFLTKAIKMIWFKIPSNRSDDRWYGECILELVHYCTNVNALQIDIDISYLELFPMASVDEEWTTIGTMLTGEHFPALKSFKGCWIYSTNQCFPNKDELPYLSLSCVSPHFLPNITQLSLDCPWENDAWSFVTQMDFSHLKKLEYIHIHCKDDIMPWEYRWGHYFVHFPSQLKATIQKLATSIQAFVLETNLKRAHVLSMSQGAADLLRDGKVDKRVVIITGNDTQTPFFPIRQAGWTQQAVWDEADNIVTGRNNRRSLYLDDN